MKIIHGIFLTSVFFLSLTARACAQPAADIAQANNRFAFDIYTHLETELGNIFFSPYSLSTALTMTFEGARHQTADEMRMALYLPSDETDWRTDLSSYIQSMNATHEAYELSTANALWSQKDYAFNPDFLDLIKGTYLAQARNLDFVNDPEGSRATINAWVSDKTKDRIKNLLPPGSLSASTRLVLTNAVYFKGKWQIAFNKGNTKPDTFWLSANQSIQTDTMQLKGKSFDYTDNDQVQILRLSYQGNELSMLVILPRSKDIQDFEKTLTLDQLTQWQAAISYQKVNVYLPKFKIEWTHSFSDVLESMGIKLAFDPNKADFSGMTSKPGLYLAQVFHKAWIDVDEEGTEAAAATGVVAVMAAMPMPPSEPKVFRADHPFIFMIQDNKTGHILFMGRVSDPRS